MGRAAFPSVQRHIVALSRSTAHQPSTSRGSSNAMSLHCASRQTMIRRIATPNLRASSTHGRISEGTALRETSRASLATSRKQELISVCHAIDRPEIPAADAHAKHRIVRDLVRPVGGNPSFSARAASECHSGSTRSASRTNGTQDSAVAPGLIVLPVPGTGAAKGTRHRSRTCSGCRCRDRTPPAILRPAICRAVTAQHGNKSPRSLCICLMVDPLTKSLIGTSTPCM